MKYLMKAYYYYYYIHYLKFRASYCGNEKDIKFHYHST